MKGVSSKNGISGFLKKSQNFRWSGGVGPGSLGQGPAAAVTKNQPSNSLLATPNVILYLLLKMFEAKSKTFEVKAEIFDANSRNFSTRLGKLLPPLLLLLLRILKSRKIKETNPKFSKNPKFFEKFPVGLPGYPRDLPGATGKFSIFFCFFENFGL